MTRPHHFPILLLLAIAAAAPARADQITVKGTTLRGKVTSLSASGVTIETEYGKGAIVVDWANVEAIATDGPFQVLHGDDQTVDARLRGVSGGNLVLSTDGESVDVATSSIVSGVPLGADGIGFRDRLRDYWRYWDGGFDIGFNLQQATTDTLGFYTGFATTRTNKPTRLTLAANYRYATSEPKDEDKSTIEDRAYGLVRGEYDLTDRLYGFASGDATYDAIQELSIRGVPKIGAGYTLWQKQLDDAQRNFLSVEAGGAWVYEKYFHPIHENGPNHQDFFAVAFGAAAGYHLPYGAVFAGRVDYLPAVDDFTGDYLLRAEAGLTVPVVDPVAVKLGIVDEYDSTPAEGADANSLYFTSALSLLW